MDNLNLEQVEQFMHDFRKLTFEDRFSKLEEFYIEEHGQFIFSEPEYNIFTLIGVGRDEDKTHSPMLADLLNPAGTHKQGFLFLKAFLKLCQKMRTESNISQVCQLTAISFPPIPDKIESFSWTVQREMDAAEYGRLDIVIKCQKLNFLCVIENKIGAGEGDR